MKHDISFWNYTHISKFDGDFADTVKEWKTLGVTVGFSFNCSCDESDVKKMRKLLSIVEKEDIKIIINDKRVFWTELKENGEQAYLNGVMAAVADFDKFKCVLGYYLGDEPNKEQFDIFGQSHRLFKQCSDKIGFMNFCVNNGMLKDFDGMENYRLFLKDFISKNKIEIVSFDRYSQTHAYEYEKDFIETGIHRYFEDLNMFSSIAKDLKLPLYASLISCGHFMYRTPTKEDIRWQLAVSFAHGASCAQWFMLYQHRFDDDYYTYPIELNGSRTEIFKNMVDETFQFTNKAVKKLDGFEFNDVWHVAKSYGGTKLFEKGGDLYVYSDHGKSGIVTEFINNEGKRRYLVTNSCQDCPELFYFEFKNCKDKNYFMWLGVGCTHVVKYDI